MNGDLERDEGKETNSGRLELTWTNKDDRLVSREDGSYEWVAPSDYRVAEVHLLHDAGSVGEGPGENVLIRGDSLHALTSLGELAPYGDRYLNGVKLAYLDPPFNTQQAFDHYDDALEHSVWLTMMRDRLIQIRKLLAADGSVWVHCDDAEQAHLRVLMDEVFGRDQFVASVIWKRRNDPRNTAPFISTDHDTILVLARDIHQLTFNPLPRTEAMDAAYANPDDDPRGPWRRGDLAARNFYGQGLYPITTPSGRVIEGPPSGSYWRVSEEEFVRLDEEGRIFWGADGDSRPYLKRYLSEVRDGRVPSTVWHPEEVGFVRNGKEEVRALVGDVFATPKPEKLLERVLQIGSSPGEVVLDCFLGSGTTAAVAHKMGRRWVGIEWSKQTIADFALPRLQKVVAGADPGGVTKQTGWKGGGGFRILDVGTSMFETDEGQVVLADWATNGGLAQATAAQLHFPLEDAPPFCGRKGKHRLAVVDGLISPDVVELLIGRLDLDEQLTLCGTSVDPDAEGRLKELRRGSRIKKIPASLLADYQQSTRWKPPAGRTAPPARVPVETRGAT